MARPGAWNAEREECVLNTSLPPLLTLPSRTICIALRPPGLPVWRKDVPTFNSIMITREYTSVVPALRSLLLLLPPALCHMQMSYPYPLHSSFNPANNYENIDYSMTSPLLADGSNFPCKGYQNDRPVQPTESYAAGQTYDMTLAGSATHLGGSCQISLSYDNGATFRVIKSMIGGCPLESSYNFTIPSYAPAGTALLAWTWQNFEGNREFYMNCAEVDISSTATKRRRRRQASSFDQLPYLWKANLAGVNDCTTSESENPVYPNPGPDVVYADGASSADPPTPGECDATTPYGQTYQDLGDTGQPQVSAPDAGSPYVMSTTSSAALPSTTPFSSMTGYGVSKLAFNVKAISPVMAASQSYTTTTVTVDCPDTVTITIYPSAQSTATTTITPRPSYYTTAMASACTGTSASCPCANGYQCSELSPCTSDNDATDELKSSVHKTHPIKLMAAEHKDRDH
ncbi:hypothetical protein LTR09_002879 [Extremus antarcticus]|uniref:Lytic polysaccharide monooxygenase n=1 Tax=Extremus antarcticus TaxID=702011 RepID=A0AAJ0GF76_9PEZI|nr:hypothetical protein LTR09_002879 [Extremus antarcticus]